MRAPTKSPTMGGRQQCRHGESAHLCPWCSYENGKEDGRKAERARIVALLREEAGRYPDDPTDAGDEASYRAGARDALVETAARVEAGT
jgi:hypothetical protein